MKNLNMQLTIPLLTALCLLPGAYGQLTPSADAYTNTATPTTNFGAKPLLDVQSAAQNSYIQFDLSAIPSGFTGSNIAKATLKLYVNTVPAAGSFNVDFVNGTWAEQSITANLAPALGSTIAASVPLTGANVHDYIIIDITPAVQAWLNGSQPNDGIALVANSSLNATFDSKESTTQSHPPELDIVFAGGGGITGVLTPSGSGLIGGGTSGTLNLSLTNTCAAQQILQWTGSAWVCAAVGTGTITGVVAGTDLTGGGSSGSVTLNVDTTKVPQLATANNFTGNQTVNGNLSATGVVAGSSYQIGSNLFAYGDFGSQNAFLGYAGNGAVTGLFNAGVGFEALFNNTGGQNDTALGASTLYFNTTGLANTASGANALHTNMTGNYNSASGFSALGSNSTGSFNTAMGTEAGYPLNFSLMTGNNNTFFGAEARPSTGTLTNASSIGANAEVDASNAMVLGSINGVNGATADTLVGIGTTTPVYKLHVGTINHGLRVEGPSTAGSGAVAVSVGGNGDFGIDAPGIVDGRFVVKDTSGFVGIKMATPAHTLEIGAGGTTLADAWSTRSSRRWKTNIQTLHGALAKVEQLRGVSYDRKEGGQHEIGVIAEEVGAVLPEIVSWEDNGKDAQGVDYNRLTALLIEAAKEQQALIQRQQREIETLQTQMKAQAVKIARLTSQRLTNRSVPGNMDRGDAAVPKGKAQGQTIGQ